MIRRRKRGFSLLEVVIVLAIVGALIAIAIPAMMRSRRKAALRECARDLIGNLDRARAAATKGETNSNWNAADRTVSAGIQILSATRYQLFIDRNMTTTGDEQIVSIVDLGIEYPNAELSITAPASPAEIRYRSNGILNGSAQIDVTVRDAGTTDFKVVRVAPGGGVKLHL